VDIWGFNSELKDWLHFNDGKQSISIWGIVKIRRMLNKVIVATGDMLDGENMTSMVKKKVWALDESFERDYWK